MRGLAPEQRPRRPGEDTGCASRPRPALSWGLDDCVPVGSTWLWLLAGYLGPPPSLTWLPPQEWPPRGPITTHRAGLVLKSLFRKMTYF